MMLFLLVFFPYRLFLSRLYLNFLWEKLRNI
jgi:hypothetical protein